MKYCENCGKKVKEEEAYCLKCGASLNGEVKEVKAQGSTPTIGILSIAFCFIPIVGIILGIIGLVNALKHKEQKSLFITSLIGLIVSIVIFLTTLVFSLALYFFSDAEYDYQFEDETSDSNYNIDDDIYDDEEVEYPYGYGIEGDEESNYDVSAFNSTTIRELVKKIENGKEYVVYIGREDCHYCGEFLPILKEAQEKHHYTTYYIDLNNYINYNTGSVYGVDSLKEFDSFIEENIGATPMVLIFKNGKYVDGTLGYQEYETFDKFLTDAGI